MPAERADPSDAFGLLRRCIPRHIGRAEGPKARVLVCAPSNSALDEIVLRLITVGLTDQDGRVFTPNVVRACSCCAVTRLLLVGSSRRQSARSATGRHAPSGTRPIWTPTLSAPPPRRCAWA